MPEVVDLGGGRAGRVGPDLAAAGQRRQVVGARRGWRERALGPEGQGEGAHVLPERRIAAGRADIVGEIRAQVPLPVVHRDIGQGVPVVVEVGPGGRVLVALPPRAGDRRTGGAVLVGEVEGGVRRVVIAVGGQDREVAAARELRGRTVGAGIIASAEILAGPLERLLERRPLGRDRCAEQGTEPVLAVGAIEGARGRDRIAQRVGVDRAETDPVVGAEFRERDAAAGLGGVHAGAVVGEPVGEVLGLLGDRACHRPPGETGDRRRRPAVQVGLVAGRPLDLVLEVAAGQRFVARALVHVEGDRPVRLRAVVRRTEIERPFAPGDPLGPGVGEIETGRATGRQVEGAGNGVGRVVVRRRWRRIAVGRAVVLDPGNVGDRRVVEDRVVRRRTPEVVVVVVVVEGREAVVVVVRAVLGGGWREKIDHVAQDITIRVGPGYLVGHHLELHAARIVEHEQDVRRDRRRGLQRRGGQVDGAVARRAGQRQGEGHRQQGAFRAQASRATEQSAHGVLRLLADVRLQRHDGAPGIGRPGLGRDPI